MFLYLAGSVWQDSDQVKADLKYSKPRMLLLDWGSIHQAQSKWMKTWSEFLFLPFRFSTSEKPHSLTKKFFVE